jgi:hypothetical protein
MKKFNNVTTATSDILWNLEQCDLVELVNELEFQEKTELYLFDTMVDVINYYDNTCMSIDNMINSLFFGELSNYYDIYIFDGYGNLKSLVFTEAVDLFINECIDNGLNPDEVVAEYIN